jgi:sortase A
MLRRSSLAGNWSLVASVCVALLAVVVVLAISLRPGDAQISAPQPAVAKVAGSTLATATSTPLLATGSSVPLATDTPLDVRSSTPSNTPSPPPTQTLPATATTAPGTATYTPAPPAPSQTPKPKKTGGGKGGDPNLLPNGVRYGDHTPDLPGRIVRITSPDVKLDARVYEVYGTSKGLWEVADYAAGHHYTSKNPGEGGNIVLSGHNNYRGEVFRYLEFMKPGDTINVRTLEGKDYTYLVESVEKLKEAGVSLAQRLDNGKVMKETSTEQLTLITCWPYTTYTHRLIVIARPVR